jgi:hypothetical protein
MIFECNIAKSIFIKECISTTYLSENSIDIHEGIEYIVCQYCNMPNRVKSYPLRRRKTKNRHIPLDDPTFDMLKILKNIYGTYGNTVSALVDHHRRTLPIIGNKKLIKVEEE